MKNMDFRKRANSVLEKIEAYKCDDADWKVEKKTKDATIFWKSSSEWSGVVYRGEATIEASPEVVFAYVDPTPEGPRGSWDKAIKQLEIIEKIADDLVVMRTVTHSAFGGLISSRDFIDIVLNTRTESYLSTNAAAVEHPDAQPTNDQVRGKNYPCSITCVRIPDDPNRTRVVTYIQTDLGGMLPKTLVQNALPTNMLDFFASLRAKLQEDNKLCANGVNGVNGDCN